MDGTYLKFEYFFFFLRKKKKKKNLKISYFLFLRAYPRLKDAIIHSDKYPELYYQLIKNMRIMYYKYRLVHTDLSEYNLL
uniref:non-specific serine/threonine protein kinase n=1 Tax=Rhizophagus irregularis (strain DAOM 181602 / DAOM 197198 / MUCL 43194) TaxID=747089 RepID=U9TEB7_RHIID